MAKESGWLSSRDAAARLDVKLETLYAYASRGLIESAPGPHGRGRRYTRESIDRLKARHDARSGHGAVAAGALRFGEPALETSISDIRSDGPYYRGQSALELCARGVGFEAVFDLLVSGRLSESPSWARATLRPHPFAASLPTRAGSRSQRRAAPSSLLAALLARAALDDENRHGASDACEQMRARRLVAACAGAVAGCRPKLPSGSVAERLLDGLGVVPDRKAAALVDRALVLCADHELNASTFAARVTASTGADLYACLGSALHTLSGALHGGAPSRVEALLREITRPALAASVMRERLARGESIPGFGQPLYPEGDPRGRVLFELAERAAERRRRIHPDFARVGALRSAMRAARQPEPNLDAGLVALSAALALPAGSAAALFAIGRMPGWIAHALEQRSQGYILRPRARYVPSGPT